MNRPRSSVDPQLRIPPAETEIEQLFAGWRRELATCRKFAPAARNYAAARLAADVGLRINTAGRQSLASNPAGRAAFRGDKRGRVCLVA